MLSLNSLAAFSSPAKPAAAAPVAQAVAARAPASARVVEAGRAQPDPNTRRGTLLDISA